MAYWLEFTTEELSDLLNALEVVDDEYGYVRRRGKIETLEPEARAQWERHDRLVNKIYRELERRETT